MLESILLMIGLSAPDLTGSVAVEAAYVLQAAPQIAVKQCCGACRNGVITHGDGHKTPCPCPDDCKCKTKGAITHPPAIIRCENGTCTLKK